MFTFKILILAPILLPLGLCRPWQQRRTPSLATPLPKIELHSSLKYEAIEIYVVKGVKYCTANGNKCQNRPRMR